MIILALLFVEVLEILGELAAAFEQFYPDVAWSSDEGYA